VQLPRRRPSTIALLTATVLVLLPVLAVFQYRWLGQVSEHERERLRRALGNAMGGVARDLDAELTRAVHRLQLDRLADSTSANALETTGSHDPASLVRDLFYVPRHSRDESEAALLRCDVESLACGVIDWPPALTPLRGEMAARFRRDDHDIEELSRAFRDGPSKLPVIVVPVAKDGRRTRERQRQRRDRLAGAALLVLNPTVLRRDLLPTLIERHFGAAADSDFRLAVVDWQRPLDVVYAAERSHVEPLLAAPEAWQELFTLRIDEFAARRSPGEGGHSSGEGFARAFGRSRGDDDEEWLLVARHREGSLQAAVDNLRRRNLLLSSGILALMGVAVGLIALTSRRAQRLAEQQVEFVAGVSHELRTPVAAIHLAAQNLSDGVVADPTRMQRYGAIIKIETQRLRDTVERVMQFASLNGRQAPAPQSEISIDGLVRDAVEAASRTGDTAPVSIAVASDLPRLYGDRAALAACLNNLLANAVKYGTPAADTDGPLPHVRVSATLHVIRKRTELRLSVEDNGPGIQPVDLPHIFEPFYRGRNALERRIQGNGLGLHIVTRIVNDHGGRVSVVSAPGRGATFTLHLPLPAARESTAAVASGFSRPSTVLGTALRLSKGRKMSAGNYLPPEGGSHATDTLTR
jgi:signal transduction histidine kinase